MEFKSLTNIESGFRRIRAMLVAFVCCCTLVTGFALWGAFRFAEKQREKSTCSTEASRSCSHCRRTSRRTVPQRRANT